MTAEYDLLATENVVDPTSLYKRMRRMGPHWNDALGGWCLSSYEDVSKAIVDPELSAARFDPYLERARARENPDQGEIELYQGLSRWFNFTDPPYHTKLRWLTQKVVLQPMSQSRPVIERLVDERLEMIARTGRVDIINELARPVALGIIASIMGVPEEDFARLSRWSGMLASFVGGALDVPDRREQAIEAQQLLNGYFKAMVEERKRNPQPDFLGKMLTVEHPEHGRFTEDEVIASGPMLIFAGHGTTTHLVGNIFRALLLHPGQLRMVRDDPKLVTAALDETLRWDSPVNIVTRLAGCDGAAGIPGIRKGDRLFLFLGAANHDPANGENYDAFDITRRDGKHLTFSSGIHTCLGAALARVEATTLLGRFLDRFSQVELAIDPEQFRWEPTVGFRSLVELPLKVS